MSGMVYVPPAPLSPVKSLQRGVLAITLGGTPTTVNVTVSAVDMAKTTLITNGCGATGSGMVRARLTSATNIEFLSYGDSTNYIAWQLVEAN